jgi:hypothetical protein
MLVSTVIYFLNNFSCKLIWCSDKEAIDKLSPGDAIIVFTPDSKQSNFLRKRVN